MNVRFYPRDIGFWRNNKDFDFSIRFAPLITLEARTIWDYKDFYDRHELIDYLKLNGVRLNDFNYPLEFNYLENGHHTWGDNMYSIKQWTIIGWMKEL